MKTATIRDLRTRFPRVREAIAREGEIVVTERGRPAYVLRPYVAPRRTTIEKLDYFSRLENRQPLPLSADASCALDEANRGDR